MNFLKTKKAFTLIELLIVVAIIAILAAIAVPNFLEAQTRAKVSRTVADMRTMATGLESYYIDHNSYPPTSHAETTIENGGWDLPLDQLNYYDRYLNSFKHLTTPLSYMTSIPEDVFMREALSNMLMEGETSMVFTCYVAPDANDDGVVDWDAFPDPPVLNDDEVMNPLCFGYLAFSKSPGGVYTPEGDDEARYTSSEVSWLARMCNEISTALWVMTSAGPDLFTYAPGSDQYRPYDPTNGTLSVGDIIWAGPGIGKTTPYKGEISGHQLKAWREG